MSVTRVSSGDSSRTNPPERKYKKKDQTVKIVTSLAVLTAVGAGIYFLSKKPSSDSFKKAASTAKNTPPSTSAGTNTASSNQQLADTFKKTTETQAQGENTRPLHQKLADTLNILKSKNETTETQAQIQLLHKKLVEVRDCAIIIKNRRQSSAKKPVAQALTPKTRTLPAALQIEKPKPPQKPVQKSEKQPLYKQLTETLNILKDKKASQAQVPQAKTPVAQAPRKETVVFQSEELLNPKKSSTRSHNKPKPPETIIFQNEEFIQKLSKPNRPKPSKKIKKHQKSQKQLGYEEYERTHPQPKTKTKKIKYITQQQKWDLMRKNWHEKYTTDFDHPFYKEHLIECEEPPRPQL